jgi:monoamine oxidase
MAEEFHSVVVVGAGISGLYAAQLLRRQFPDILVVEAQDRIGGRIMQVSCWCVVGEGPAAGQVRLQETPPASQPAAAKPDAVFGPG